MASPPCCSPDSAAVVAANSPDGWTIIESTVKVFGRESVFESIFARMYFTPQPPVKRSGLFHLRPGKEFMNEGEEDAEDRFPEAGRPAGWLAHSFAQ
ncbi:hypothetical protein ANTPLA_LOCUS5839 [Anthophora plagiata]